MPESMPVFMNVLFCPGPPPGRVQAASTTQTRMWAPSTTTWSLWRAAAWPRSPPRSPTHRCSSSFLSIPSSVYLKGSPSVRPSAQSVCLLLSTHTAIPSNSSRIQLCIVQCLCVRSYFICHSPECIWPAEYRKIQLTHRVRWEMNDSAEQSPVQTAACGECHAATHPPHI